MNVKDDPLLKTFDGHTLMGSYDVDDEGVPAESIDVVLSGKLLNYEIGREPIKDFPDSNGHGRAGLGQPAAFASGGRDLQIERAAQRGGDEGKAQRTGEETRLRRLCRRDARRGALYRACSIAYMPMARANWCEELRSMSSTCVVCEAISLRQATTRS